MTTPPSTPPQRAQAWHDYNTGCEESYSTCYCCCPVCELHNPYLQAAFEHWRKPVTPPFQ